MTAKYRLFLSYAIPMIVALAICVVVSHQVRQIALSSSDNTDAFYSFTRGLSGYEQLRQEWRPRILSNYLAGKLVDAVQVIYHPRDQQAAMAYIPAIWSVIWLFLTFLLFITLDRERSLLYIFGIFAGISFAYTPGIGVTRVYPWDLTALFAFACFIAILKFKQERWLVLFIPIAMLLKETVPLMVVALLFWDKVPIRKRLVLIGITLAVSISLRAIVDLLTANPSLLLTMTIRHGPGPDRYVENIRQLLDVKANPVVFIDSGLLATLLLLPVGDRRVMMLKAIGVLLVLGNLFFGTIIEYRIWFEAIPLALYAIELYFFTPAAQTVRAERSPSS